MDVTAVDPTQLLQSLLECRNAGGRFRVVRGYGHKHADAPHVFRPLRLRIEWPRGRRAPKNRDELPPLHSITSSARASSEGGMARRTALAVLRLITNSNLVGCCTG